MTDAPTPEFSSVVRLEELDRGPARRKLEAGAAEREALARRFDLLSLDSLVADVELRRAPGGSLVLVEGRFAADVVQKCAVTLEPAPCRVEESVSEFYGPPGRGPDRNEDEEPPEPFDGDGIDVGELVAQRLSLALEPYPRAPGVEEAISDAGAGESGVARRNPFAELAKLRKKS